MKNYFKKCSVMFVMSLILILGSCTSVFAADSYENGTANLKGTTENSAKVGDKLTAPEVGWKRCDDTNSKIIYTGTLNTNANNNYYKGTFHMMSDNGKTKFYFTGDKLRIISYSSNSQEGMKISIDGISYGNFSTYHNSTGNITYYLLFENTSLTDGVHFVEIMPSTTGNFVLDAIDIDKNGYLVEPSITLDSTSLTLAVGDSEQLTATTTPASVEIEWTSSDSNVATVDSTGEITAVKEGTCTITSQIKGSETKASCIVTVTKEATTEPTNPPVDEPTADGALFIELVDGNIKQYDVSSDEINKFINWYKNRDNDDSQPPYYKFTKGSYKDYVVHDKIDWFEVR